MKLLFVTTLVVGLALSLTPTAVAKDLTQAQACGRSDCAALPRNDEGDGLRQLRGPIGPISEPPRTAPYYRLNFEFGRPAADGPNLRITSLYVPSANLVAANGMDPGSMEWFAVSGPVLEEAVRNLEPFATPKRWSTELMSPSRLSPTSSRTRNWIPWSLAAAAALFAVAVGGFLCRRFHGRRLRPAEFA